MVGRTLPKSNGPQFDHAGLDRGSNAAGERSIQGAEALPHHRNALGIEIGSLAQRVDDGADHLSPLVGDGKVKGGLALARAVDRERRHAAVYEGVAPSVQFLLAGIEPGQNDRYRRPAGPRGRRRFPTMSAPSNGMVMRSTGGSMAAPAA